MTEPADFLAKLAESDPKAAERLRKAEMAVKGHSTRFATVWADEIKLQLDQPAGFTHEGFWSYTKASAGEPNARRTSVLPADARAGRADFRPGLGANGSHA